MWGVEVLQEVVLWSSRQTAGFPQGACEGLHLGQHPSEGPRHLRHWGDRRVLIHRSLCPRVPSSLEMEPAWFSLRT